MDFKVTLNLYSKPPFVRPLFVQILGGLRKGVLMYILILSRKGYAGQKNTDYKRWPKENSTYKVLTYPSLSK